MFLFTSCSFHNPVISNSATILIKTPKMKFYDKGFISKYENYTQVQIFSAGIVVLNLKIYDNQICRDTFLCQSLKSFNRQNLDKSYDDMFLKNLFDKKEKEVIYRDKSKGILIKILRD
jgi:hypothetical protein